MQSLTSSLLEFYSDAGDAWKSAYETTNKLEAFAKNGGATLGELGDMALVLKKTLDKINDARSEINKALALIEPLACAMWVQEGSGTTIRGELSSCTPRSGVAPPSIKRKDNPELFDEVMQYFGFSKEAAENELARLHWPNVEEHMRKLNEAGKPLPKCLKGLNLQNTWSLTCRQASGVNLDELALELRKPGNE